jgi:uncharacterized protein YecE (DUF72 family)
MSSTGRARSTLSTGLALRRCFVGTSGWSLSRAIAPGSSPQLTGLERYAEYFSCVEINSTFYRMPRPATLERWRDSTPSGFRFAVKLPRAITHEAALVETRREVTDFCRLVTRLEPKLGPLLVQLPPSLPFDAGKAARFFAQLKRAGAGQVVLEPRHPSWFSEPAAELLLEQRIARVAADPERASGALEPAGCRDVAYFRWHGSPRMYFSSYTPEVIGEFARHVRAARSADARRDVYCFFDNTALGAAAVNALSLKAELLGA